jgi:hypothetical protein
MRCYNRYIEMLFAKKTLTPPSGPQGVAKNRIIAFILHLSHLSENFGHTPA